MTPAIRYYQLHQLLQYHVIGDNVHVACQLLAMVSATHQANTRSRASHLLLGKVLPASVPIGPGHA